MIRVIGVLHLVCVALLDWSKPIHLQQNTPRSLAIGLGITISLLVIAIAGLHSRHQGAKVMLFALALGDCISVLVAINVPAVAKMIDDFSRMSDE